MKFETNIFPAITRHLNKNVHSEKSDQASLIVNHITAGSVPQNIRYTISIWVPMSEKQTWRSPLTLVYTLNCYQIKLVRILTHKVRIKNRKYLICNIIKTKSHLEFPDKHNLMWLVAWLKSWWFSFSWCIGNTNCSSIESMMI